MKYKKQGKNSISRNISESDLTTFAEYDGSVATRNQLLYKLGVDTSMSVEVIECQHRNLQGKVVEGKLEKSDLWFHILGKRGEHGPYRYDGKILYQLEFPKHYLPKI